MHYVERVTILASGSPLDKLRPKSAQAQVVLDKPPLIAAFDIGTVSAADRDPICIMVLVTIAVLPVS